MKAQHNLYTTIGNTSWLQRGAAALAALLLVAAGISLGIWTLPAAQAPAAPQAAPAADSPSAPSSEISSLYDGSAYVEYLAARPAASNPNVPVIGAGSAYDGGAYGAAHPASAAQPIGLGIDLPAGTERNELPAGLADYIRPSQ